MRRCLLLVLALALAPAPAGAQEPDRLGQGAALYLEDCVVCHGLDGRGPPEPGPRLLSGARGAGPPLRGVGALSAHFYLTTGYMPIADPHQQPQRREPPYSEEEVEALIAYVASLGDGPPVPEVAPEGDLSEGLRLYTDNCAGCHQVVIRGGPVVGGPLAPSLEQSTPTQIAAAIRLGPHVMPAFGEDQLDDDAVNSIIAYVKYAKDPRDDGGWGIGHIGSIPEGLVAWLVAGVLLVLVARFVAGRPA